MEPHHRFFRARAMKEYMQRQEKDILPRFLSPYITILSYLLLLLLLLVGLLAWWGEVPLFISGSGVVLTKGPAHTSRKIIVIFLPAKYVSYIHSGADVELYVEPAGRQFSSTIKSVEAQIINPDEARKRYLLNDNTAQVITQPSVAATLLPGVTSAPHLDTGDLVGAQVRVGSQHILSFCLGLHEVIEDR